MRIVFEDGQILVIDKPAGWVVNLAETSQGQPTIQQWLAENFQYPIAHDQNFRSGIVHRLDKDTSGLLLVAKTKAAFDNLQSQFKERRVKKVYVSLVHGKISSDGKINTTLGRNPRNRFKFMADVGEKASVTEYKVTSHWLLVMEKLLPQLGHLTRHQQAYFSLHASQYTLVDVFPLTGRTHQIRVHLKYMGHPVVADQLYAPRKLLRLDHLWCHRQFLHAKKIGFFHPTDGNFREFESDLPEDLSNALSNLKKQ